MSIIRPKYRQILAHLRDQGPKAEVEISSYHNLSPEEVSRCLKKLQKGECVIKSSTEGQNKWSVTDIGIVVLKGK